MIKTAAPEVSDFPFATEFVTDRRGRVAKVVLPLRHYRALVEAIEDAALHRAMKQTRGEKPLSRSAGLALLFFPDVRRSANHLTLTWNTASTSTPR